MPPPPAPAHPSFLLLQWPHQVPWDDLRYIFGEIMYGGHITDNKDRRLCSAYLNTFLREELLESLQFFPAFEAPPPLAHAQYLEYIEEHLATETPTAYGLHTNSETNFMMRQVSLPLPLTPDP
jgi:dynein heavy chain